MAQYCYTWEKADFEWNLAPSDLAEDRYTWDDVCKIIEEVIDEVVAGGGAWASRDKDKKKRKLCIKLIMYRNNIKVYDERKCIKNINLYIDDIKIIAEELKKDVQIIH